MTITLILLTLILLAICWGLHETNSHLRTIANRLEYQGQDDIERIREAVIAILEKLPEDPKDDPENWVMTGDAKRDFGS